MYPLFESISVKNSIIQNYEWHQERFLRSYVTYYGQKPKYSLADPLEIPEYATRGTFKLRVSYGEKGQKFELDRYEIKEIKSLQLIEDNEIEYNLKYTDRSHLKQLWNQKGVCDDVLIVKNGLITDTSFCNIVFYDGEKWLTPDQPLLEGTARARLLDEGRIIEAAIGVNDIKDFSHFKLINAMRDFDWVKEAAIEGIVE